MYSSSISTETSFHVAGLHGLDPIPRLDPDCRPPEIIGTAAMTTAMMHGAGTPALAEMIGRLDHDPAAALFDTATALHLAFRPEQAAELQLLALQGSALYRIRNDRPDAIRLLALMSPGDLMANTPLDFITNHLDVQLDLLFMLPGMDLPAEVPDHDLMIVASAEPDPATLGRMRTLFRDWPRPVLNDPALLPRLARDRLPGLLAHTPGLCSPPARVVERGVLETVAAGRAAISCLLPDAGYPVLVRPSDSHAGIGLARIDSATMLASYLAANPADPIPPGEHHPGPDLFTVTAFVDYCGADGLYRKYRIAFADRSPQLCHMAVSSHWMVHYLNAGMTGSAAKRAEEAAAMQTFDDGFAARHADAFEALHDVLPLDFFSIDCAELPDGRLLVFEADTAAIIHLMDPADLFPYKHAQMTKVFAACDVMLRHRLSHP